MSYCRYKMPKAYRDGGRVVADFALEPLNNPEAELAALRADEAEELAFAARRHVNEMLAIDDPPDEPEHSNSMPAILLPPHAVEYEEPAPPPPRRRSIPVSAPVSRTIPGPDGRPVRDSNKITLTGDEIYIARHSFSASDMTSTEKEILYAKNKMRMLKARERGEIS